MFFKSVTVAMSKKNSKKNHQKMRNTAMAREEEEAAKKAARAAKRAAQAAEAAGEMAVDDAPGKTSTSKVAKKKVSLVKALGAKGATLKRVGKKGVADNKGLQKIVRGVRVGHVMKKVKLRKDATVRGIKIVDGDTKRAVIEELKAEAAMAMALD